MVISILLCINFVAQGNNCLLLNCIEKENLILLLGNLLYIFYWSLNFKNYGKEFSTDFYELLAAAVRYNRLVADVIQNIDKVLNKPA